MTGDQDDIITKLKLTLPTRWFPDETPVLDSLLTGLSMAWTYLYALLLNVKTQARIATATGSFLDMASFDFFGPRLARRSSEADGSFRLRLQQALVREHATRAAVVSAVKDLTGFKPTIFEPSRITDTGAYSSSSLAYGSTGAWGSLNLPFQVFVTAQRPASLGIANVAGYGTGGPIVRATLSDAAGQVTNADIAAAVAAVMPTASTAWINITN